MTVSPAQHQTSRVHRPRPYLPIAEHGLIGDLHTVALVGTDGTIDWCCLPRLDSPSVFAAILDAARGGYFRIAPEAGVTAVKQLYLPDTNVLLTRASAIMPSDRETDFLLCKGNAVHKCLCLA